MKQEFIYHPEYNLRAWFYPAQGTDKPRATIVFLYASGYRACHFGQFKTNAEFLAEHGFNTVLGDYRVSERDGSTPFDSIDDAFYFFHYLKDHAEEMNIDFDKIVMSGASAGGEMTFNCAIKMPDIKAAALMLFYPSVGLPGRNPQPVSDEEEALSRTRSPYYIMNEKLPPCVIFHGDADEHIPMGDMYKFVDKARDLGTDVTMHIYSGRKHNFSEPNHVEDYEDTLVKSLAFLERFF